MFKIIRNGRRFNNKTFTSYELARSYLRKWIRKNMLSMKWAYANPTISKVGFKITAI